MSLALIGLLAIVLVAAVLDR